MVAKPVNVWTLSHAVREGAAKEALSSRWKRRVGRWPETVIWPSNVPAYRQIARQTISLHPVLNAGHLQVTATLPSNALVRLLPVRPMPSRQLSVVSLPETATLPNLVTV